ncbi:MAG: L,D-transpeptidase family protein [Variibacter sp.]
MARLWLVSAALAATIGLSGCNTEGIQISAKHLMPLSSEMVATLEKKGMSKDAPILIRAYKEEAELEVWKQDSTGQFALLKIYPICRWSGELGPKMKQGDRQAPEGFYTITPAQMNPNSAYYLSFNLGYPNAYDRAHGYTGSNLMVHGNCSSAGCYSMTDEQIGEIFALGREAFFGGQKQFQVQAYPFRMTAMNMARHRNSPHMAFWRMLKQGSDTFEVTHQQPKVDVCEKRYVFDAQAAPNARFEPAGRCPAFTVPSDIAEAVAEKTRRDDAEFAKFARQGIETVPVKTGRDGGMHPIFMAKLRPQLVTDGKGNVRWAVENPSMNMSIGTIRPPRDEAADLRLPPKLASADPAALPAQATEAPQGSAAAVPMPRPVPNRAPVVATASAASAPAASSTGKLFNGLFSSKDKPESSDSAGSKASSFVRALGFGNDDASVTASTTTAQPPMPAPPAASPRQATPTPAPRPHSQPARHAPATHAPVQVARPAPQAAPTADDTGKAEAARILAAKPVPAPRRTAEAEPPAPAAQRPASAASLMNGAAPVVPTGSFESRWQTFR